MDEDLMESNEFQATNQPAMVLPIGPELDLHAFAPRDVVSVVSSYLEEARAKGLHEVRIVHGKGIGFQREAVRKLLRDCPFVRTFGDCPRGGKGATLVTLI